MANEIDSSQGEDMIGKLVAAAGRGPTAPPEVRERVYAAVRARWESETGAVSDAGRLTGRARTRARKERRQRSWMQPAFAMAAAVGVVAITLGLLQTGGPNAIGQTLASLDRVNGEIALLRGDDLSRIAAAGSADPIIAGDLLRTGAEDSAALSLGDGLELRMNRATELQFVSADEISLTAGTIYIDSGTGISRNALSVQTTFGGVAHVGTQYEVHVDDRALRIRVREGRVAVTSDALDTVGIAGEQLDIVVDGLDSRGTIAPDDPAWDWAVALARLPAMPEYEVGSALEWVARELGLSIEWNSAVRNAVAGNAIIGLDGLTPSEALDVIALAADIETRIEGNRLIVSD